LWLDSASLLSSGDHNFAALSVLSSKDM